MLRNGDVVKVKAWDLVELKYRTEPFRVYTYKGKYIFAGMVSDTVTDESRDEVVKIIKRFEDNSMM